MDILNKIVWIEDDLTYVGNNEEDGVIQIARIEKVVIDDNMIKILTKPQVFGDQGPIEFVANLNATFLDKYEGTWKDYQGWGGIITCEKFENSDYYLLIGKWEEVNDEEEMAQYSWIAKFSKKSA